MTVRIRGDDSVEVRRCTGGTLTGSRVAGQLGRLPVEQALFAFLADLRVRGWVMPDGPPLMYTS